MIFYNSESVELLAEEGFNLDMNAEFGINPEDFGEFLLSSGLVLMDDVRWISFHGGYDYAYLIKLMTSAVLPSEEETFFDLQRLFFPHSFDVKYMVMQSRKVNQLQPIKISLQGLSEEFGIQRVPGLNHQVGSESLLTKDVFFEIRESLFPSGSGTASIEEHEGKIWGIGINDFPAKQGDNESFTNANLGTVPARDSSKGANVFQFGKIGGS